MAAVARYLADTSALSRLDKPSVRARLGPLIERRFVGMCGIIELELLYTARNSKQYEQRRRELLVGFASLSMPDEIHEGALECQRALAGNSAHRNVPMVRLLVAATAARHGVTLLHYDRDFDTIAAITGQDAEWVVPAGTAD